MALFGKYKVECPYCGFVVYGVDMEDAKNWVQTHINRFHEGTLYLKWADVVRNLRNIKWDKGRTKTIWIIYDEYGNMLDWTDNITKAQEATKTKSSVKEFNMICVEEKNNIIIATDRKWYYVLLPQGYAGSILYFKTLEDARKIRDKIATYLGW